MTEPTRTTNPVKVGIGLAWEIKVDNYVHGDDIDTTSEDIRRDETASFSTLEVMENSNVIKEQLDQLFVDFANKLTGFCHVSPFSNE